jgi:hypothetical protein
MDRDLAAELMGTYVEKLWAAARPYVGVRQAKHNPRLFVDWERMQNDTRVLRDEHADEVGRQEARRPYSESRQGAATPDLPLPPGLPPVLPK